jgi:hypothetical protein
MRRPDRGGQVKLQAAGIRRRYLLTTRRFRAARDLLVAADRMRDRWAEAGPGLRDQLWGDLHNAADEFRETMA